MKLTTAKHLMMALRALSCVIALLAFSLLAVHSQAALIPLSDDNSSILIDTSSSVNAFNWLVDGEDQMTQQAFWFRVGNVGGETSLHSLPHPLEVASNTNFDPANDTLAVRYNGAGFYADVRYSLDGGSPGSLASDLGEQISIVSTSATPLDFHFFQYVDLEMLATPGGDMAEFTNVNAVRQFEGALRLSETVATLPANHRQISFYNTILASLSDAAPTTLSDNPPIGAVFGPGDLTWAFQWDFLLPAGGTFQISKDKRLSGVPEPATFGLLGIASLLLPFVRRKR